MKNICNTTTAACTQQLGNLRKPFLTLLIGLFVLISSKGMGQVILMNDLEVNNITRGSFSLNNNQWEIIGLTGNPRGYQGNLKSKKGQYALLAGNTYTVQIQARAIKNSASITLMHSSSATQTGMPLTEPIIIDRLDEYYQYSATFTVSASTTSQYFSLAISNSTNNSELYIHSLVVSACTLPPSVGNASSCSAPSSVMLSASGATSTESYRWYIQETGGTPLTSPSGNILKDATYITPLLTQPQTFYVTRINNETLCESPRMPIVATVGRPNTPTLISNGTCSMTNGDDITFTASGASENEEYRWYTTAAGGSHIVGEAGAILRRKVNFSNAVYVEIVNRGDMNCRSNRVGLFINKTTISNRPTASNGVRCGAGELTLTASGAEDGQTYRWYRNGNLLGQGLTFKVNVNANTVDTYEVSISSALCEGPRVNITASSRGGALAPTGQIAEPDVMVIGSRAIFKVVLSNIPVNEIESYEWYRQEAKSSVWIPFSGSNLRDFTIEEMPGNIDGLRVDLKVKSEYAGCYTQLEGESRNIFRITNLAIVPLPVELVAFKAQRHTKGVNLTWATASEQDNSGFEVQVSTDSRNFQKVGFVGSKVGTSSIRQDYSFLDTRAVTGTRYYRLKQVDFDGTATYSAIKSVSLDGGNGSVVAYPNPFDDVLTVRLNGAASRNVKVILTNMIGETLWERTQEAEGNSISLDMRQVTAKGVYILHVIDSDTRHAFKLMKR